MNKEKTKKILRNVLETNIYSYVITIILFITIIIPVIINYIFIPAYKEQFLSIKLEESKKVARHLFDKGEYSLERIDEVDASIKSELEIFDILKVRYYNNHGVLVYSTIKDEIGDVNENDYFVENVVKGEIFYKIEQKGKRSFEDEKLHRDVIEIYIPRMENGTFHSAFELYYDIGRELSVFNKLSNTTMNIIITSSICIFVLFFIIIFNASKNNLKVKEKQKQLKAMAHKDSLTNLYNRRYFCEITNEIISLSLRNNESLSLAMIDIDYFKNINDTYGHNIGDKVIKTLAKILLEQTRQSDVVCRFGGEEFIILFPNTCIDGARNISNKLRLVVEELNFSLDNLNLNFTISIGISEYKKNQTLDEFIHQSDKALYVAKRAGRNKVEKI